jgi:hypothetical protein
LERNEHIGRGDAVLLREAADDVMLQKGRVVRAER